MVNIAIAGGTGGIGKTIAEVLSQNVKHKVFVLSRKAPGTLVDEGPGLAVDYGDVGSLVDLLKANDIHTVISTIRVTTPEAGASEVNLAKAAGASGTVKRFIASDWGGLFPDESDRMPQHALRIATITELRTTNLEWTTVRTGYFADYFGMPHIKSHLAPLTLNVDVANKAAVIPGTGNDPVTFTYSFDVAKLVVAALDLPRWEEELLCVGDTCTLNEVVKLAEEARGSKFDVTYDDIEKIQRGEATELPSHKAAYQYFPKPVLQQIFSKFNLYILRGLVHLPEERSLTNQFPDIKTKTVKEIMDSWKGK